jgi:hypothetical protein
VAAEQWLWRHYTSVLDFSWLWLPALKFKPERWSVNRILRDVRGWPKHGLIENWAKYFRTDPDAQSDWLATYMRQAGTWPQPPIVIENNRQLQRPDGLELAAPFQLMEGHHRMGFFRALAALDGGLASEHDLLVVDVPAVAVLDYWPLNEGA